MLLTAEKLEKNYGVRQLLGGVTLYLEAGDRVGVIGVNGTGKSTLLRLLAGAEEPDAGRVTTDPGVRTCWLPQDPPYLPEETALAHVLKALPPEERETREYEAKTILNRLGVGLYDRAMGTLSGGQRKRASLAAALLRPSDVLLLDEPTNHLDAEMTLWLERTLQRRTGGLVMVTHDRWFLQNVCNRILELSLAETYEYEANWEKYLELKLARLETAAAGEQKRQNLLRIERQWMMRGARARSTKNRAHIRRYEELRDREGPAFEEKLNAIAAGSSRLGRKTIELTDAGKSYGGRPVVSGFTYTVLRNDRIGIVGRNGAGKTTLLNLIAGTVPPDEGRVERGDTVKIGYFTQDSVSLDPEQTAAAYIREIAPWLETAEGRISASAMMERFLFGKDLQYAKIGTLSGGEKRRLFLLGILMGAPNVLLLDEPTNDLDIDTLTVLESYLQEFPGAVLAVSHDRYFLDKIADHLFELAGDGRVVRHACSVSEYLEREKDRQPESPAPEKPKPAQEPKKRERLKFTFREQREFETIEDRIAGTEAALAAAAAEEEAHASDYVRLQELAERKAELEAELERLMDRWVYLNERNEQIEAERGKT